MEPGAPLEEGDGITLARMTGRKQFQGDLQGTSTVHMLTAATGVERSGAYVAVERISGTLHGRRGSFVVQHNGTMTRGTPHLTITVVPDSGTGELAGLAGTMQIRIAGSEHFYELEYTLSEAR
jgi:hypothetical protein